MSTGCARAQGYSREDKKRFLDFKLAADKRLRRWTAAISVSDESSQKSLLLQSISSVFPDFTPSVSLLYIKLINKLTKKNFFSFVKKYLSLVAQKFTGLVYMRWKQLDLMKLLLNM